MKIYPEKLASQLQALAPIYLVGGEENLLIEEALDQIRAAARQQEFSEREVLHADKKFDWSQLHMVSASLSLFGSKRLVELRIPNSAPGKEGSQALIEYATNAPEDTVLLVVLGKFERGTRNAKWYKNLDSAGVSVECWPVDASRLPSWVSQRLRQHGLHANAEAIELLCTRVEGNLLAAKQEIDKLALLLPQGNVDAETIADAVASSARYDVFGLVDAALQNDLPRVTRMVAGLKAEGAEPIMLNSMLARELRTLSELRSKLDAGQSLTSITNSVWAKRKPIVSYALPRYSQARLHGLLLRAGQVDRIAKGAEAGNSWHAFTNFALAMAGKPLFRYRN